MLLLDEVLQLQDGFYGRLFAPLAEGVEDDGDPARHDSSIPIRDATPEEVKELARLGAKVMTFAVHAGMTETFKVAAFVTTQVGDGSGLWGVGRGGNVGLEP